MKKLLKVLLWIAAIVIIAIAAVFYFTAGMASTADRFFAAVKNQDMTAAYAELSEAFKETTSKDDLEAYLKQSTISEYASASWDSRTINLSSGTLDGSVTTQSGGVIPLTLHFVKDSGDWKIYSIDQPGAGLIDSKAVNAVPSEDELVALVHETTLAFSDAIRAKDMAAFREHVSKLWQQQFTVDQFEETYGAFYALENGLEALKNFVPSLDAEPSIDNNGVMTISGRYTTKPDQLHFQHKYIHEGLSWRLLGFSVQIK